MMNPEIKEQWIAAIPAYKRGYHQLRSKEGDSFCPLGVLCDLHQKATDTGQWRVMRSDDDDNISRMFYDCGEGDSSSQMLPTAVREWAGIQDGLLVGPPYLGVPAGVRPIGGLQVVACANDGGSPLERIINLIQTHL